MQPVKRRAVESLPARIDAVLPAVLMRLLTTFESFAELSKNLTVSHKWQRERLEHPDYPRRRKLHKQQVSLALVQRMTKPQLVGWGWTVGMSTQSALNKMAVEALRKSVASALATGKTKALAKLCVQVNVAVAEQKAKKEQAAELRNRATEARRAAAKEMVLRIKRARKHLHAGYTMQVLLAVPDRYRYETRYESDDAVFVQGYSESPVRVRVIKIPAGPFNNRSVAFTVRLLEEAKGTGMRKEWHGADSVAWKVSVPAGTEIEMRMHIDEVEVAYNDPEYEFKKPTKRCEVYFDGVVIAADKAFWVPRLRCSTEHIWAARAEALA